MSFGQPSWIAAHLLGAEFAHDVHRVESALVTYGSTAGPWGGIGGAAMSAFQMTLIVTSTVTLVFADERLLGWVPREEPEVLAELEAAWADPDTLRDPRLRGLLRDAASCPVGPAHPGT